MEDLDISQLEPGRKLARGVFSKDGRQLFAPGETLSPVHIKALRDWGFTSVTVEPLHQSVAPQTSQAEPAAALRQPEQALAAPPRPAPAAAAPQTTQDAAAQPSQEQPEDLMQAVRDMTAERFRLLDTQNAYARAVFELAVERQGRVLLRHAGKLALRNKPSPAFQTQKPPRVSMQPLIEASHRMGTLPMVFHHLVEMINNPESTIEDIAKIIAMDPALTAKLLKLVNSPFYGLAYKIDTINRAVVLVGTRQLVMLAMGATLVTTFKGVPVSLVNMQSFWSHSISCGAAARLLAQQARLPQHESFFVAGLLHDIARLLIYTQLPNHSLYLLTESKRREVPVYSLEQEALGFTHEELGAELLRSWNCPPELVRRVLTHHTPLTDASSAEDAVLPTANMLVQALGYGSSGEYAIPQLDSVAWDKIGIPLERLPLLCAKLDEDIRNLRALFTNS